MIALRLDTMRGEVAATPTRDAFAAIFAPAAVQVSTEAEVELAPAERQAAEEAAKEFQKAHRLQAVLVPKDGGAPRAMVDGALLVIGEPFKNARLVEIWDKSVIFEVQGVRVELALRHGQTGTSR